MTPSELVAVISSILGPISVMFGLWIRERRGARVRRTAEAKRLQALEGMMRGTHALIEDLSSVVRQIGVALRARGIDVPTPTARQASRPDRNGGA